jgi:hypothetical protein
MRFTSHVTDINGFQVLIISHSSNCAVDVRYTYAKKLDTKFWRATTTAAPKNVAPAMRY